MARPKQPNQGAQLLKSLGKTQAQIASEVGTSSPAVTQWMTGTTRPVKAMREVLWAKYRVPKESWDRPIEGVSVDDAPLPEGAFDLEEQLKTLEGSYYRLLRASETGAPLERAKLLNASGSVLAQIAKIRGDDHRVGQRFLKSPEWKRIKEAIERGARGFPEAAAAIARELRALDDEE